VLGGLEVAVVEVAADPLTKALKKVAKKVAKVGS